MFSGYDSIEGQESMALDRVRNQVYLQALKQHVTPDSVVLDLGAGLGTLGLLAAKLGARKVYMVEPAEVVRLVPGIARDNGIEDRVECIRGRIEDIELPEKVDIILSVFTGNFLLSENLLPSLFHARDHYLKPGGVLLPDSAQMCAVPVTLPDKYEKKILKFERDHLGLDFTSLRRYRVNRPDKARFVEPSNYLSDPQPLPALDFYSATRAKCHERLSFDIFAESTCHGFAGWFDIFFGSGSLSTGPEAERVHWSPLVFYADQPIPLCAGESMEIKIDKSEKTDWSWAFHSETGIQRMSGMKAWVSAPSFVAKR